MMLDRFVWVVKQINGEFRNYNPHSQGTPGI